LKKFFFFWKKPLDKPEEICYNNGVRIPFSILRGAIMNRSYTENKQFSSDCGIYEAFYTEVAEPALAGEKRLEAFLSYLLAIWQILTGATARRLAKVTVFTLCLVGTVGVVGAMELGRISLSSGLLLSAVMFAVQCLCFMRKKVK
jgi:hypothetical protein